ncbi:MAG: polysaccharide deacetylase family protein [Dysgonamonadaceae bacterium]|jgi:hypothetical protein|nr:polysaccharide deacetylase family protein [Dysgonamonadaceae bacterium]
MLTIYSLPEHTNRLRYVACHLFEGVLGTAFRITSDQNDYLGQKTPCINYSEHPLGHGLQMVPHGLLAERGVRAVPALNESEWKGLFCFFYSGKGDIPFDLFSASFYLLTLYEEYDAAATDEHGRFDHRASLLFRHGCLETPLVDRWAYLLKEALEAAGFPTGDFRGRQYRAIHTYDIDHPYLYRNKGLVKNAGGALRDLLRGNVRAVGQRIRVLLRLEPDPFWAALQTIYAHHTHHTHHTHHACNCYLFVLLGRRGKHGRTTLYPTRSYFRYLKRLDLPQIGLHPSYDTFLNSKQLKKEKAGLERILQREVTCSRQHFLRLRHPDTFRDLLSAGIREDFSLAFSHAPGFRSGTAVPHPFYDMQTESPTALLLRPTVLMDTTLIRHLHLSPDAALQRVKSLADACKQSGGDFLSLWHNSNLAAAPAENPWTGVHRQAVRYAVSLEEHGHAVSFVI